MKTGDTIQIKGKELSVLKTHFEERKSISWLIQEAADLGKIASARFWDTVYGLYPELKEFDIHINWKTKVITARGRKERE